MPIGQREKARDLVGRSLVRGRATPQGAGGVTFVQSFPYSTRSPGSRVTKSAAKSRPIDATKSAGGEGMSRG
jgi:hypothetical protein